MRQKLSEKKINKYRNLTKLPIVTATVRGGTDHRVDLFLEGGKVVGYYPKTGIMEEHTIGWDWEKWKNKKVEE